MQIASKDFHFSALIARACLRTFACGEHAGIVLHRQLQQSNLWLCGFYVLTSKSLLHPHFRWSYTCEMFPDALSRRPIQTETTLSCRASCLSLCRFHAGKERNGLFPYWACQCAKTASFHTSTLWRTTQPLVYITCNRQCVWSTAIMWYV